MSGNGRPWEEMTPADFGTDDEPQQWALFPVDSQGRVGGDLFESADSEVTR